MPYDGKERTTSRGKVVYERAPHPFSLSDLDRIITVMNNKISSGEAKVQKNAIKIRSIFTVAGSLFSLVDEMFDKPEEMPDNNYYTIKAVWRENTDELIGMIAAWTAAKSGVPQLGVVLNLVGRWINRGMEYLFTGHTER